MAGNRRVSNGKEYWYYRCPKHQRDGSTACEMNRNLPAAQTERRVLRAVLDAVKDRDALIENANAEFEAERRRLLRSVGGDPARWQGELEGIERRRANYQRAFAADALSLGDLKARTSELDAEKSHVERLLAEHENQAKRLQELETVRQRTVDLVHRGEWGKLGITKPEARRNRYSEIGLSAEAEVEGTIRVRWTLGEEVVVGTTGVTS